MESNLIGGNRTWTEEIGLEKSLHERYAVNVLRTVKLLNFANLWFSYYCDKNQDNGLKCI